MLQGEIRAPRCQSNHCALMERICIFVVPNIKLANGRRSFSFAAPVIWNSLPEYYERPLGNGSERASERWSWDVAVGRSSRWAIEAARRRCVDCIPCNMIIMSMGSTVNELSIVIAVLCVFLLIITSRRSGKSSAMTTSGYTFPPHLSREIIGKRLRSPSILPHH